MGQVGEEEKYDGEGCVASWERSGRTRATRRTSTKRETTEDVETRC